MGKKLIIKGADFSENGVVYVPQTTWYIDRCTKTPSSGSLTNANLVNGGWCYKDTDQGLLQGNKINTFKMLPFQAGVFEIYKSTSRDGVRTKVASFIVEAEHLGNVTTYYTDTFELENLEILSFGKASSEAGFKYIANGSGYNGFYSKIPSNPSEVTNANDLNFSVGYSE